MTPSYHSDTGRADSRRPLLHRGRSAWEPSPAPRPLIIVASKSISAPYQMEPA